MTERTGQGQQPYVVSTEVVKCNDTSGQGFKDKDALITVWSNGKTECSIRKRYTVTCYTCPQTR